MKPPIRGSGTDSLIEYLNTHTAILTDQGINVRAFIDRLTALTCNSTAPAAPPAGPQPRKYKTRKK